MRDELDRQAHAIFVRALAIETDQRPGFVAKECAGNLALSGRVGRLIAAIDRSTDFLERPALGYHSAVGGAAPTIGHSTLSVPGYRVVRVIGTGGMATVYEAVQQKPERTVALKVMNRALTNTSAVQRFQYETEVLARLQHPGIAQIFEAGTCDDGHGNPLPYFAMELVLAARTITAYATEGGLSLHQRLALFTAVCDAVQHGHQHGVIHRDLKPANILVDSAGRIKIIDFGVARPADGEHAAITRRTSAGQVIGTLNSMSPEQCSGVAGLDVRSDVYSLGVLLYQLLSGRLPHDLGRASIPEAVRIILQDQPPRISSLVPAARGDLEAIVMMAMDKEPARRYGSAGSLAADIRRFLNHQTIDARQPTVVHQARLFAQRNRVLVASGVVILALLVTASALIALFAYRTTAESRRRSQAEQAAVRGRDLAQRQAYVASIAGAFSSLQVGEFGQVKRRLNLAPDALRNWEWWLLSAMIDRGERTIAADDDMILAFAHDPSTERIATGSRNGSITTWDARTGQQIARIPGREAVPVFAVALSQDGYLVSGSDDCAVRVWDATTGSEILTLGDLDAQVRGVACGREGIIAAASSRGDARLWNLNSTEPPKSLDDQPGGVHGVAFSADGDLMLTWGSRGALWVRSGDGTVILHRLDFGDTLECAVFSRDRKMIAAGGARGKIKVWRTSDAELIADLSTLPSISSVRSLAFTPDSSRLASGQIDRSIRVWDLSAHAVLETRVTHDEAISGLSYSANGDSLYSASWDRTVRVGPFGAARPPNPYQSLPGHEGHVLSAVFSPDGTLIASAGRDGTVRLWDATLGAPLTTLRGHTGDVCGVQFAPDGSMIASVGDDGAVRLWSALSGESLGGLPAVGSRLSSVWFSPDGRRIASAGQGGTLFVWDLGTRSQLLKIRAHEAQINAVRYSPDGSILATVSRDGLVRLWDSSSGALQHSLPGHRSDVFAAVFTHDGKRLYSGSRDQTVRVWDVASGTLLETLASPGQFITSLSLSPDGTRLAAGSWFSEIILWDVATHDLVASFKGQNSAIRSIAFSPDGRSILCGGHDSTLSLYNATPSEKRASMVKRSQSARAAAQHAIERLSASSLDSAALLATLESEFRDDPDATRWARALMLDRPAPPNRP